MFQSLDAMVGGDDNAAASWLDNPNSALDARPIETIQIANGLFDVIVYLDAAALSFEVRPF